jgi:hypothetical protein
MTAFASNLAWAIDALECSARRNTELHATAASVGHKMELSATTTAHVGRYDPDDVEPLTHFHTTELPKTGVADMYRHLADRAPAFDDDTGLIAVTLMLRYQRMTGLPITMAMLHRLFITAVLVASKFHHERGVRSSAMARRFGIRLQEMNLLERCLVVAIDYRCMVVESDVDDALADLVVLQHGRPSLRRPVNTNYNRPLATPAISRTPSRCHSFVVPSSAASSPAEPLQRTATTTSSNGHLCAGTYTSFVASSVASSAAAPSARVVSPLSTHAEDAAEESEVPWVYA